MLKQNKGTYFDELKMLSLIVNKKTNEKPKNLQTINIEDEEENLNELIGKQLTFDEFNSKCKELYQETIKASTEIEEEDDTPKKFVIEELKEISFKNKSEAKTFTSFTENDSNSGNDKPKNIISNNEKNLGMNDLIKDLSSMKIDVNKEFMFGFNNKFFDYFNNLKV